MENIDSSPIKIPNAIITTKSRRIDDVRDEVNLSAGAVSKQIKTAMSYSKQSLDNGKKLSRIDVLNNNVSLETEASAKQRFSPQHGHEQHSKVPSLTPMNKRYTRERENAVDWIKQSNMPLALPKGNLHQSKGISDSSQRGMHPEESIELRRQHLCQAEKANTPEPQTSSSAGISQSLSPVGEVIADKLPHQAEVADGKELAKRARFGTETEIRSWLKCDPYNAAYVRMYTYYVPIIAKQHRAWISEAKKKNVKPAALSRQEHLSIFEDLSTIFWRERETYLHHIHLLLNKSYQLHQPKKLICIPKPSGAEGIVTKCRIKLFWQASLNNKKDQSKVKSAGKVTPYSKRRFVLSRVWVHCAHTPIRFCCWQRIAVGTVLALAFVLNGSLLVLGNDPYAEGFSEKGNTQVSSQYDVYFEGQYIGTTGNRYGTQYAYKHIADQLSEELGMSVVIKDELVYKPVFSSDHPLTESNAMISTIADQVEYEIYAIQLVINGQTVGIVKDEAAANAVLDALKQPYLEPTSDTILESSFLGFAEAMTLEPVTVDRGQVLTQEQLFESLISPGEEQQTYLVQAGDSLWGISSKLNMSVEALMAINPEIGDDYVLSIGQELSIVQPKYLFSVLTSETVKYITSLEYETEYIEDPSMYKTQSVTVTDGEFGEVEVIEKIVKSNGMEVESSVISETVLREPVTEVIKKGTKEPEKFIVQTAGTGIYMWPSSGTVSSEFGPRWSSFHSGIDIANQKGTPIYAADSGTVTYSGYNSGGYGNLIKIYHGDGVETRYGHLSTSLVEDGDSVQKGQLIGYMGSTGRSTGNHLHFEVRVAGVAQNPREFLQ